MKSWHLSQLPGHWAFTLAGSCDNAQLFSNEACALTVTFAPTDFGSFSGSLSVTSDDPDEALVVISLTGGGNTLPPAPQLLQPVNGATVNGPDVMLAWTQAADADGDSLTHTVVIAPQGNLGAAVVFPGAGRSAAAVMLAGAGSLLLAAFLAGCRRRWRVLVGTGAVFLLLSCGGGGGGSGGGGLPPDAITFEATNLVSGFTYQWKVVVEDARGGVTESAVRSFTVQ